MIEPGIKGTQEITVEPSDTAASHGSGTLDVFATPALVALAERTAWMSIADVLEAGTTTVGTSIELQHLAPTPLGKQVRCESELVAVDARKLTFSLEAYDETGKIGEGVHQRFIVDAERFQQKANSR